MALSTFSVFYYGFNITSSNNIMDFNETGGASGLQAEINIGAYTFNEFLSQIETALSAAGTGTYSVSGNRATRSISITGPSGGFDLLTNSGPAIGTSPWALMGFDTDNDQTGATGYSSQSAAGSAYFPQFKLQDYISKDDEQELVDTNINESANGDLEIINFGLRKFVSFNIQWITNRTVSGVIQNNATGVSDAQNFMQYIINKRPIELMLDVADRDTFDKILLETTEQSNKGTGYRLKEWYTRGMPGFYETGKLKFRILE